MNKVLSDLVDRPTVVVVGGGAAGALSAIHLAQQAGEADRPLDLVVVEPSSALGRGVAYSTADDGHLLNVPAGGMSAFPDRSDHFVAWARLENPDLTADSFVARSRYGRYLEATLVEALGASPAVRLDHRRA